MGNARKKEKGKEGEIRMFTSIKKRDGRVELFEVEKITNVIRKAGAATGEFDYKIAQKLTLKVLNLAQQAIPREIPTVEEIQDVVEEVLLSSPYRKTAKAYIIYREQHAGIREITAKADVDLVDQYLEKIDWQVNENSNMSFSLQGLNNYVSSEISKIYWMRKIYTPEVRQAHSNGDFHIHDLNLLSVYCVGWDLFDLLVEGFKGAQGKIESKPAKHLRSALGQIVNFFYTLQGEAAGAQAFSFDAQTPIVIKRNSNIEIITLEMLFNDYKHHTKELNKSEVIFTENIYRRYSIDDADKRKYLDSRLPSEPILFLLDQIEVFTEKGFVPLNAISRHKIGSKNDELLIIETEDGNILRITRSHPVILSNGTIKRGNELNEGDELLSTNLRADFPSGKIELQSDFAYLIGFMIAEGCWGHQTKDYSIISQKKNTEGRKKIEHILKKLKIPYHENEEFNIVFGTTRMGRFIRNRLKLQEGSHRKNLPAFVFDLTKENIGDIISGIIDGDGDVDRGRIVRIHSTSYTLLMQLKQILGILGINSTVRYTTYKNAKKNWKDAYVIRFHVDEEHIPIFRQSIKLQNVKIKVKESPKFSSEVVKIIEAKNNSEYVYDITTENEHFLINNIVVHNSNFDTLLAPFIRYDGLSYKEVKQALQEFVFNINVPTRVGFQTPFTNITLDLTVPKYYADQGVIIGGEIQKDMYREFQEEMELFNEAFLEVMAEGDAKGRVFTFPIPTYNITKDFDWANPNLDVLWQVTAKYGVPYFSNFINSDMNPEDARSMCPIGGNEKVLIKSNLIRGRGLEYSTIKYIYEGNAKGDVYEIYSDGKFVKGRFNKFAAQKMIKVTLENGHVLKMTEQHLNFVMLSPQSEIEELKGIELREGMYLPYSLKAYEGSGGNKDMGYFVGAFAGDGSFDGETSVVFSLSSENERKRELVRELIRIGKKYFGASYTTKSYEDSKLYTLKVHSRAAVGLCKDFVSGKERDKCYRARLFNTGKEFRKAVIEGHYATDGGNRNRIYTSSPKMVETLNMLAASLGTTTSVYMDNREGRLGTQPNYAVLIYQLNREKYGNIWFKHDNKLWVEIKSIEPITDNTAYCFEVESGEPMFTVGTTGILTHNCRLRIDNRELEKRGGGLFGSSPLTGSIGVVTLNMPRLGYLAKDEDEFISALERLMVLAKESLEVKRKILEKFTGESLYPYTRYYLRGVKERFGEYWKNHFSTIGLVGMNEACLNMFGENIASKKSREFTSIVLDFMRGELLKFQAETGNNYNLEATPAEGTSYRLAKKDKEKYPGIVCANEEEWAKGAEPFYTNSTQLPVNYTEDVFEALDLQDAIQTKYTGGCLEAGNKVLTDKGMLKIETIVKDFAALKPVKALSYNPEEGISEWDEITDAVTVNLKRQNKIRVKGERGLDIVTSDWHPFFILEKVKPNPVCPVCGCGVKNIKSFATHLRWNPECRIKYRAMPKYRVVERRADELEVGDYILQNSCNLYPERGTKLNPDLMWLIGFFIGDGSVSEYVDNRGGNNLKKYKVRFSSEQQAALRKATKILNKYFCCKVKVIQNDKRSEPLREVTTSKKEVAEFFLKLGFMPGKKVYNISIPKEVKDEISCDNVYSLLSGLGDSDGHIGKRDGDFEYSTVSSKLAEDILEICTRAGIMVSKGKKIKNQLSITVNKSRIKRYLSNRKKRYLPVVRVKEVSKEEVQDNQFYDLTTQKNHNYLAGRDTFVFVHNTVFHVFAGERVEDPTTVKVLVRRICELYHLPYFTFTPTFSVCPAHGYITGEHYTCPECGAETEVYSRVVGYLRPVTQWNKGKREEFKQRKTFVVEAEALQKLKERRERKADIALKAPQIKAKAKRKYAGKQLNLIDFGGGVDNKGD